MEGKKLFNWKIKPEISHNQLKVISATFLTTTIVFAALFGIFLYSYLNTPYITYNIDDQPTFPDQINDWKCNNKTYYLSTFELGITSFNDSMMLNIGFFALINITKLVNNASNSVINPNQTYAEGILNIYNSTDWTQIVRLRFPTNATDEKVLDMILMILNGTIPLENLTDFIVGLPIAFVGYGNYSRNIQMLNITTTVLNEFLNESFNTTISKIEYNYSEINYYHILPYKINSSMPFYVKGNSTAGQHQCVYYTYSATIQIDNDTIVLSYDTIMDCNSGIPYYTKGSVTIWESGFPLFELAIKGNTLLIGES